MLRYSKASLSYAKFKKAPYKIVLLDTSYHVQGDCADALTKMGHEVGRLEICPSDSFSVMTKKIMVTLLCVKPDMLLSINHYGFDAEGRMAALLSYLEIPMAVWYVDVPLFALQSPYFPSPENTTVWTSERLLLDFFKSWGAQEAYYLPLATSMLDHSAQEILKRANQTPVPEEVVYVGHSLLPALNKIGAKLSLEALKEAEKQAIALQGDRQQLLTWLKQLIDASAQEKISWDIASLATLLASQQYRQTLLSHLCHAAKVAVYGDPSWQSYNLPLQRYAAVAYGLPLAAIYCQASIHFNMTSWQLPTAVNQRLFDVPAVGGFLLSDHQQDNAACFDIGSELIVYHNAEDLADKVRFYLAHPLKAQWIAQKAHRRITQQHTYQHRMADLLKIMVYRYGSKNTAIASPIATKSTFS